MSAGIFDQSVSVGSVNRMVRVNMGPSSSPDIGDHAPAAGRPQASPRRRAQSCSRGSVSGRLAPVHPEGYFMARIAWIEDDNASGEIADLYRELKKTSIRGNVPDILRTMSLRPDFLRAIDQASRLHFTDGALSRPDPDLIPPSLPPSNPTPNHLRSH